MTSTEVNALFKIAVLLSGAYAFFSYVGYSLVTMIRVYFKKSKSL